MRTKDLLQYLVALMMGTGLSQAQLTQTENYVYSKTYLSKTGDTLQKPAMETVTYFDGLGRPKQSIIIKGTPSGQDLVTPIKYDGFGRQALDILPVPVQSTNSGYHAGIIDETTANTYYSSPSVGLGGNVFSEKILENSPLDRIQAQYGPGDAWKSNSKKTEFFYETNGTEVKRYAATFNYATFTSAITLNGAYPANTLYRNRIKDEDGNTTMEYKNGAGQTILVRKIAGTTISPVDNNVYADTYYIYNDYNQLAFVIPPLAVAAGNVSQTTLENLCYQYKYDGRGRLVEKKLPGKEWEFMVYDKKDRLILTQDINLRGTNNNFGGKGWLFTKYDQFGRVVYTGFFANTATRSSMQTALNNMNSSNNEERVSAPSITLQGLPLYYTKTAFPTGSMTLLSVNYYDTYPVETPFPTQNKIFGEAILLDSYGTGTLSTKSLLLASLVKNINDDSWTKNYTFYDKKGRPIGNHSTNHLGGNTIVHSRLDFTGTVQKTKTYHRKLANELPVIIEENFEYDNQNRLVKHYHEVMGKTPKELLTQNEYNEIGTLKSNKVGATGNGSGYATPLQSINYDYNIRGWLTGINLNRDKTLSPDKLFSYKIRYDNPTNPALQRFNGNISEVDWTFGADTSSRYDYSYDMLNRLRKADFKTVGITETSDSKFFNEELQYDLNGNITELKRFAKTQASTTIGTMIDELQYTYDNSGLSNRVISINDLKSNSLGYKGNGVLPITYDANGNMKTFPDKGITQNIVYNYLNLPETIVQNGFPTNNIYRADGVKVHKNYAINGTIINTDYMDGFVYTSKYTLALQDALSIDDQSTRAAITAGQEETFELAERLIDPGNPPAQQSSPNFFPTAEGFYDFENFKYIYQYKDHLGNVRLSYSYNSSEDKIDIEDTNNYYPFGLSFITENAFVGSQYSPSTTYKNYKYNGKELQETGMYDYGARMYMPDIGRWATIDPLAEVLRRHTPYNYGVNNPVMFVDPDGMLSVNSVQEMWENTSSSSTWTNSGDGTFDGGEDPPVKKNPRKAGSRPEGMSEKESLSQLVTIDGKKYHKNTTHIGKVAGNAINSLFGGDDDYFVEHKEYDPVDDRFSQELVSASAGSLGGGLLLKGGKKALGALVTSSSKKVAMTTVGRWMSKAEYEVMATTNQMVEGAGGQTFVSTGGPNVFTAAAKGSVYAEFQVPTNSLLQGGQANWFKAIGPSAKASQQYLLQKQGGPLLPTIKNLTPILKSK